MPAPDDATVRLRLRYPDLATFVERFAPNVTRGGVFIASRDPRPVGEVIRFEISLLQGPPVLSGSGKVTWTRPFEPAAPHKPHGMGVQFTSLDPGAKPVLDKLLAARAAGSQPKPLPAQPSAPVRERRPSVDPNAFDEFARVEESVIRRALDSARVLGRAQPTDDIEALLRDDGDRGLDVSFEQARNELQRLLTRRNTGMFRAIPEEPRKDEPSGPKPSDKPDDS